MRIFGEIGFFNHGFRRLRGFWGKNGGGGIGSTSSLQVGFDWVCFPGAGRRGSFS